MNRLLTSIPAIAVTLALGSAADCAAPPAKPNVIIVLSDDQGYGDFSCHGNPVLKTPNLDRLAQQGTLFTQFYVNGSVCSPSRCAFMTGQYPARHRIHGHYADHSLDGEDASDILLGRSRPRRTPLMWEWRFRVFGEPFHRSPMLAIRDGDWKLLLNPDRSRVELYDIRHDPTQLDNVADQHKEVVDRLAENVLAWQKTLPPGPVEPAAGKADYPWPGQAKPPRRSAAASRKPKPIAGETPKN